MVNLVRSEFREWLRLRGENVAGAATSPQGCPLATYLQGLNGGRCVFVNDFSFLARPGYVRRDLPGWAAKFIRLADATPRRIISGNAARHLLLVCPETEGQTNE